MSLAISLAEVVAVPINSIVIGARRREKLGRLQALAKSIATHGLIHPILLRGETLVAGHRRLEACRSLNWKTIPARQVDRMSDDELRALELGGEHGARKPSDYATSKARLAQIRQAEADLKAKAAAEAELLAVTAKKSPQKRQRGRPKTSDSRRAVAEATGLPDTSQRELERHVELGERYPFLQRDGWRRHLVLDAGDALDKIPETDRSAIAVIVNQPGIPPKTAISMLDRAASMNATERSAVIQRSASADELDRRTATTILATVPPPPDPGLLALNDAVESCKQAAARCRSAIFKPRVVELSEHTAALRDEFRAHERKERARMETPIEQRNLVEDETIGDLIRRVFVDLGSNVPARTVTQFIIDGKLLPAEMKRALLFRGLNDHVRRELARITIEGLPFAQPTGTKKQSPWKQLDLFTRDEAHALVRRRLRNLYEDHGELVRLQGWCVDKFGDAPDIPDLPPLVETDEDDSSDDEGED
jgi:hypothetical protein